jgi:hypothetical protein
MNGNFILLSARIGSTPSLNSGNFISVLLSKYLHPPALTEYSVADTWLRLVIFNSVEIIHSQKSLKSAMFLFGFSPAVTSRSRWEYSRRNFRVPFGIHIRNNIARNAINTGTTRRCTRPPTASLVVPPRFASGGG